MDAHPIILSTCPVFMYTHVWCNFPYKKYPFLKRDNMFLVRSFFKNNFELIVLDLGLCGYIF